MEISAAKNINNSKAKPTAGKPPVPATPQGAPLPRDGAPPPPPLADEARMLSAALLEAPASESVLRFSNGILQLPGTKNLHFSC